MSKVKYINGLPNIFCPACNMQHGIDTRWRYNGKAEAPTFKPEVVFSIKGKHRETGDPIVRVCKFKVTDGKIEYLDKTTHERNGQVWDLPDWDDVIAENERLGKVRQECQKLFQEIKLMEVGLPQVAPNFDLTTLKPPENPVATFDEQFAFLSARFDLLKEIYLQAAKDNGGANIQVTIPPPTAEDQVP